MDPLSIATATLTLISTLSTCTHLVKDFAIGCRDARQDLTALSRELSDLDMTLHILKDDYSPSEDDGGNKKTGDGASQQRQKLPDDLRQRIVSIMENCNGVLDQLKALLKKYDGAGSVDRTARWALSGRKEAEKIRASLQAHKGALGLVVEAGTLHMTTAAASDARKASNDTSLIKEYTMKIVEQLAKQDEILEQIAWIRAVLSQRPASGADGGDIGCVGDGDGDNDNDNERSLMMDKYLDSMTDYAGSVCGDPTVSDDVAEEMRRLSLMTTPSTSTSIGNGVDIKNTPFLDLFDSRPSLSSMYDMQPESMKIVLGNTHRLVTPKPPRLSNKHLWSFYVQSSGEEIIQEVQIYLHPTFTPSHIKLHFPPYRVTSTGWGYFVIDVTIILKPGYQWHSSKVNGNRQALRLEWELDFGGLGSSKAVDCGVVVDRGDFVRR